MFGKNIISKLHLCIKFQQALGKVWKSVFSKHARRGLVRAPGVLVLIRAATQGMPLDCLALGAMGGPAILGPMEL